MQEQGKENHVVSPKIRQGRARLLGVGLDDASGHFRYTRTEGMELYGGSSDAHARMQRRAEVIRERLNDLGISLDHMTYEQYLVAKKIVDNINTEQ